MLWNKAKSTIFPMDCEIMISFVWTCLHDLKIFVVKDLLELSETSMGILPWWICPCKDIQTADPSTMCAEWFRGCLNCLCGGLLFMYIRTKCSLRLTYSARVLGSGFCFLEGQRGKRKSGERGCSSCPGSVV